MIEPKDRADELLEKANNRVPMTQREVAELATLAGVKLSKARIFQIEQKAIAKLRGRPGLEWLLEKAQ